MKGCLCAEGKISELDGSARPNKLNVHNCSYIEWRNELIPQAEHYANETMGSDRNSGAWGLAFHRRMNVLARNRPDF